MLDHDYYSVVEIVKAEDNTCSESEINNANMCDSPASTSSEAAKKRRIRQPEKWKKNIRKKLRNSGQEYISTKNKLMPARVMRERCDDCKFECEEIKDSQRLDIFKDFWALGTKEHQWSFIARCMVPLKARYRRRITAGQRKVKSAYFFELNECRYRVCKHFFLSTLGISNKFTSNIERKMQNGDQRGKYPKRQLKSTASSNDPIIRSIRAHIASIPRIESHILRNSKSTWEMLCRDKTFSNLHRDYVAECFYDGFGNTVNIFFGKF